jgi:ATP/maltotriose-dependent transcriptional regulator MalT
MLETMREFGLERLAESGEEADYRRAHAEFFLAFAEEAEPRLVGPDFRIWLERLDAERDNLRAAMTWAGNGGPAEVEIGLRLAAALRWLWQLRHLHEGRDWLQQLSDPVRAAGISPYVLARGSTMAGLLAMLERSDANAETLTSRGLELSRQHRLPRIEAFALMLQGGLALRRGDLEQTRALTRQSVALAAHEGDPTVEAAASVLLGRATPDEAERSSHFERAVALMRDASFIWGTAWVLDQIAVDARIRGNRAAALSWREQSLRAFWELGDRWWLADGIAELAVLTANRPQAESAARLMGMAARMHADLGARLPRDLSTEWELAEQSLRAALPGSAFDAHREAGAALPLADAVAESIAIASAVSTPVRQPMAANPAGLTTRELDILQLIGRGLGPIEIAEQLFISRRTVDTHLHRIYEKLEVSSRTQAIRYAVDHGLT